jgi:hypothetical protein
MLHRIILAGAFALVATSAHADHEGDHTHSAEEQSIASGESKQAVSVAPDRVVVQVNGMVCSFCAYGVEKSLSKMEMLDHSQFGGDGVHVDIDNHLVTLALKPGEILPLEDARQRIRKGGYDPVRFYLRASGSVEQEGDVWTLEGAQKFRLAPGEVELSLGSTVELKLQVEAADTAADAPLAAVDASY